jgi:predicted nucleotidyltransferase component of viral defense system
MKTSNQLKALVRNLSRTQNVAAEFVLRNFMLERLLERIAQSGYRNHFLLKGGLLIAAMVGIDARSTMDMDVTLKDQSLSESEIVAIMTDILNLRVDDGVVFTLKGIEEIRQEADYPGYRVSIEAVLDKTRQILKIDITTGDRVTPGEIEYDFKLMFEDRTIIIPAYNLETVLAEKYETIVTRGTANTRMRDFYDVYVLTATHRPDSETFRLALERTVERRRTASSMANAGKVIDGIAASAVMIDAWRRYRNKYDYAKNVSWEMAIEALKRLLRLALPSPPPLTRQRT